MMRPKRRFRELSLQQLERRRLLAVLIVDVFEDVIDGDVSKGNLSLREAIIAANQTPEQDRVLLGQGTYLLSRQGILEDESDSGDLDVFGDLIIEGLTDTASHVVIDGGLIDRVIDFHATDVVSSLTLLNLTIRNGLLSADNSDPGAFGEQEGAGVRAKGNVLQLENVNVEHNEIMPNSLGLGYGGGLFFNGLTAKLSSTVIADNKSSGFGGGIAFKGADLTISESSLQDNQAKSGGAIYLNSNHESPIMKIDRSSITTNAAVGDQIANNLFASTTTVSFSLRTGVGGGIYADRASFQISNSTVSANTATYDAGGIFSSSNLSSVIAFSTIANNSAKFPGRLNGNNLSFERTHTVALANSIVANQGQNGKNFSTASTVISLGGNLIDDVSGAGFDADIDILGVAAQLNPLEKINGRTYGHRLSRQSLAIDRALTQIKGTSIPQDIDQLGVSRSVDGNFDKIAVADIGALEYVPVLHSLGDLVFLDENNSGFRDTEERGIADVDLELYADSNNDGVLDLAIDELIQSTTTNSVGRYRFQGLDAGSYFLRIPENEFVVQGPLYGLKTSDGNGVAAPDPSVDLTDGDDNGQRFRQNGISTRLIRISDLGNASSDSVMMPHDHIDFGFASALEVDFSLMVGGQETPEGGLIRLPTDTNARIQYRVRNIGEYPLAASRIIDDSGTPGDLSDDQTAVLLEGDENFNGLMDVNEVWLYESNRAVRDGLTRYGFQFIAALPGEGGLSIGRNKSLNVLGEPDIDLQIIGNGTSDPGIAGLDHTLQFILSNAGPSVARSVQLSMELPSGVSFRGTDQPWAFQEEGGVVTIDVGDLSPGSSTPVQLTLGLDGKLRGIVSLRLNLQSHDVAARELQPADNQIVERVVVESRAEIQINLEASTSDNAPGYIQVIAWIQNLGPSTSSSGVIAIDLPFGTSLVGANPGEPSQTMEVVIDELPVGGSQLVSWMVVAEPAVGGELEFQVELAFDDGSQVINALAKVVVEPRVPVNGGRVDPNLIITVPPIVRTMPNTDLPLQPLLNNTTPRGGMKTEFVYSAKQYEPYPLNEPSRGEIVVPLPVVEVAQANLIDEVLIESLPTDELIDELAILNSDVPARSIGQGIDRPLALRSLPENSLMAVDDAVAADDAALNRASWSYAASGIAVFVLGTWLLLPSRYRPALSVNAFRRGYKTFWPTTEG